MFQSDMVEEIKNKINIKETRIIVVKQMVNFIYMEKVQESCTEFHDLLALADQYQIEDLMILCGKELVKHEPITWENVVDLGVFGENHNCDVLVNKGA